MVDQAERSAIERAVAVLRAALTGTDRTALQAAVETLDAATVELAHRRMSKRIGEALENKRIEEIAP